MTRLAQGCLILLALATASGCSYKPELQNLAFVTAIGIDYEEGQWTAYAQILNFSNIASTERMEIGKPVPPWIGRGSGNTITMALSEVRRNSQLQLFWGHVKTIVLSERAMAQGVTQIHKAINRYREVRYNVLLYGTKEKLEEVFAVNSLLMLSPLDSLLFTGAQLSSPESFILPRKAYRIVADMNEPGTYAQIASIGFNATDWISGGKPAKLISLNGIYYFRNDKLIAWMPTKQLKGIRWAEQRLEQIPVQMEAGGKGVDGTVIVFNHPHIRMRAAKGTGNPVFDLKVDVKGYVLELGEDATMKQLKAEAKEVILRDIGNTFRRGVELKCDPFNLQQELYRSQPGRFWALSRANPFFLTNESLGQIKVDIHLTGMGKYKGRKE